jgi:hypothetical protein
MQKCCKNSFNICDDFVGCPEELFITVPTGYPEEDIIIRIYKNGKIAYDIEATIDEGGIAAIYADDLPDGFINPYGSTFSIQFVQYSNGEVYEFMVGGGQYDSLEFNVIFGQSTSQAFNINIF